MGSIGILDTTSVDSLCHPERRAGASVKRCCPRTRVARIIEASELLDRAIADDLDHRRRHLERRGILPPRLHVRRAAMGVEMVAALPTLDHHEQIRVVDAGVIFVGDAALFLPGLGYTFLRTLDVDLAGPSSHAWWRRHRS